MDGRRRQPGKQYGAAGDRQPESGRRPASHRPPAASLRRVNLWHPDTRVVAGGRPPRVPGSPVSPPIVPTSTYQADGPVGYARHGNPSVADVEAVIGDLEGGRALTFSSGMAAAAAILDDLPLGTRVLTGEVTYNGVYQRMGELAQRGIITVQRTDLTADPSDVLASLTGPVDLLWCETPSNPLVEVIDVPALVAALRPVSALRVVVDSTLGGPLRQQPLTWGADVVLHSATKALAGHSDVLLGALIVPAGESGDATWAAISRRRVLSGGMPSPFDAWLTLRGMRTLALRTDRMEQTAQTLTARLSADPRVMRVRYPGFGSVLAIEPRTDGAGADALVNALRLWWNATSLGGVESLAERRRRWPDEPAAVPEALIRLSVGIEHPADLWSDLDQALAVAVPR